MKRALMQLIAGILIAALLRPPHERLQWGYVGQARLNDAVGQVMMAGDAVTFNASENLPPACTRGKFPGKNSGNLRPLAAGESKVSQGRTSAQTRPAETTTTTAGGVDTGPTSQDLSYADNKTGIEERLKALSDFIDGQAQGHDVKSIQLKSYIHLQFQKDWRYIIDPAVLRAVRLVCVKDKAMDRFNLEGPAYSFGNQIFIRRSVFDIHQTLVADGRLTFFGRVLIHELVARHLALRQRSAEGRGDAHHWAARNVEQQLEMTVLMNYLVHLENRLNPSAEDMKSFDSHEGAPVEVCAEIASSAFSHGLSQKTVERIIDAVSRRNLEGVKQPEDARSMIIPLQPDEYLHHGGKILKAICLKAVTYKGQPPVMIPYVPSPEELITQPPKTLSVDRDRRIRIRTAPPQPTGTTYIYSAINEYNMMKEAFEKGSSTGYPIGFGRFTKMFFNGKPVGFVIIAKDGVEDARFGSRIIGMEEKAAKFRGNPIRIVKCFREAYIELGRGNKLAATELRKLHEMGITHTHPHHDNYSIPATGSAKIYDFTNAASIRGMSRDEFIIRVFNDFRALYLSAFHLMSQGAKLEVYEQMIIKCGLKSSPLEDLVDRYFTDEDRRLIGAERLRHATSVRNVMRFILDNWSEDKLEGKRLEDLDKGSNDIVRIFKIIAGGLYDRLTRANEAAAVAAPPVPTADNLEAANMRLEIAAVKSEIRRLQRTHQEELQRIEDSIQTNRRQGIFPSREDMAVDDSRVSPSRTSIGTLPRAMVEESDRRKSAAGQALKNILRPLAADEGRPLAAREKTKQAGLTSDAFLKLPPEHTICFEVHNYLKYGELIKDLINSPKGGGLRFKKNAILVHSNSKDYDLNKDRTDIPNLTVIESIDGAILDDVLHKELEGFVDDQNHLYIVVTGNYYKLCVYAMFESIVARLCMKKISFSCHFIGDKIECLTRRANAAGLFETFTDTNVFQNNLELSFCIKQGFHTRAYLDGKKLFDKVPGSNFFQPALSTDIYYWTSTEEFRTQMLDIRPAKIDMVPEETLSQIGQAI